MQQGYYMTPKPELTPAPSPTTPTTPPLTKVACGTGCKTAACLTTKTGCSTGGAEISSLTDFAKVLDKPNLTFATLKTAVGEYITVLKAIKFDEPVNLGVPTIDQSNKLVIDSAVQARDFLITRFSGIASAIENAPAASMPGFITDFKKSLEPMHKRGSALMTAELRIVTPADLKLMRQAILVPSTKGQQVDPFNRAASIANTFNGELNAAYERTLKNLPATSRLFDIPTGKTNTKLEELEAYIKRGAGTPKVASDPSPEGKTDASLVRELASLPLPERENLLGLAIGQFKYVAATCQISFPNILLLETAPSTDLDGKDLHAVAKGIGNQLTADKGNRIYNLMSQEPALGLAEARLRIAEATRAVRILSSACKLNLADDKGVKQFQFQLGVLDTQAMAMAGNIEQLLIK